MDLKQIATDVDAVDAGVWKQHPMCEPGIRIKVRGKGSKAYRKFRRTELNKQTGSKKKTGDAVEEAMAFELMCIEPLVADWKGITQDGQPLECTPATVREMLQQREYERFFLVIDDMAGKVDADQEEDPDLSEDEEPGTPKS